MMEVILRNDLIIDHVLKFVPLRRKLVLRCVNQDFMHWMELATSRSQCCLKLSDISRLQPSQLEKLLAIMPNRLSVLHVDRPWSSSLWSVIKDRLLAAGRVIFKGKLDDFMVWYMNIDFSQAKWTCVDFEVSFNNCDQLFTGLLDELVSIPRLKYVSFPGGNGNFVQNSLRRGPLVILSKITEIGGTVFESQEDLNNFLLAFPNLRSLHLDFDDDFLEDSDRDTLDSLDGYLKKLDLSALHSLSVGIFYFFEDEMLSFLWRHWPHLR